MSPYDSAVCIVYGVTIAAAMAVAAIFWLNR